MYSWDGVGGWYRRRQGQEHIGWAGAERAKRRALSGNVLRRELG